MQLDQEQILAINCSHNHISLIAGAGSGKTTVLSLRAKRLAEQDEKVLILTFSNRAARAIRLRCINTNIEVSTFHAFAYKYVRNGQTILSEYDVQKILKDIVAAIEIDAAATPNIRDVQDWISKNRSAGYRAADVPNVSSIDFQEDIGYNNELTIFQHRLYTEIYGYYERYCSCTNTIDFDDMQLTFYEYLLSCPILAPYQHILVDEYQDTDQIQYEILKRLIELTQASSFVVGDPRQSIYMFRGAKPTNFMSYLDDFRATELFLKNNYRSNESIVLSSNNIASSKYPKAVAASNHIAGGVKVYVFPDSDHESEFFARKTEQLLKNDKAISIAFLFRMNRAAKKVEEALIRRNIPYKLVGITRFSDYAEMRDLLSWAKLVYNNKDAPSFVRALSTLHGVGSVTLRIVGTFSNAKAMLANNQGTQKQLSLLKKFMAIYNGIKDAFECCGAQGQGVVSGVEAIRSFTGILNRYQKLEQRKNPEKYSARERRYFLMVNSLAPAFDTLEDFLYGVLSNDPKQDDDGNKVILSTIHKSKGLQYHYVFLLGWVQGVVPMNAKTSNPEEEKNIAYVGLTRARRMAFLSCPESFQFHRSDPSPFLETILPRSQWVYVDS